MTRTADLRAVRSSLWGLGNGNLRIIRRSNGSGSRTWYPSGVHKSVNLEFPERLDEMNKTLLAAVAMVSTALAQTVVTAITYDTTGSTLSCSGVSGCIQNSTTSISIGGLTLVYSPVPVTPVTTVTSPSQINFGNVVWTGSGAGSTVSGISLAIKINSTPPSQSGTLQSGLLMGSISMNSSTATLSFSPNNTTTTFGTLPGVVIGTLTYQVQNTTLGLVAPTSGNPAGQTTIQGAISGSVTVVTPPNPPTTPIPPTLYLSLLGIGAAGLYELKRRRSQA